MCLLLNAKKTATTTRQYYIRQKGIVARERPKFDVSIWLMESKYRQGIFLGDRRTATERKRRNNIFEINYNKCSLLHALQLLYLRLYKVSDLMIRHKTSPNISHETKITILILKNIKYYPSTTNYFVLLVTVKLVLHVLFLYIYIKFNSIYGQHI